MSIVIGLTGGIASGKTTVAQWFIEKGWPVIDADIISREVVQPGEVAYNAIVQQFGKRILTEDGHINRKKLGQMVFSDREQRSTLNEIIHPTVRKRMREQKEALLAKNVPAIILDIPLLFENERQKEVDTTLLIDVSADVQLQRLMKRNDLTKEEAQQRINAQMPLSEKRRLADACIDNSGSLDETYRQLQAWVNEQGLTNAFL
ncbi:dephospho-CoA kinase [Bacillaceae bacterium SIJ1]|uniref:dephospho-CoA kinase n=1 Tax=Litoribacterium kuwaitense TaxID=1398745 RepID=UPI0013ECE0E3|nr:dephospho-CoA kinase [Litoribacterium kuwaitense]NGP45018.1 dephospho-CoA kinase [Litoribacterium kuwaitense]